jgi:hypothetical protein
MTARISEFEPRWVCDVCGQPRRALKMCQRCCLESVRPATRLRRGVGHLAAEHGHEVQREAARW